MNHPLRKRNLHLLPPERLQDGNVDGRTDIELAVLGVGNPLAQGKFQAVGTEGGQGCSGGGVTKNPLLL